MTAPLKKKAERKEHDVYETPMWVIDSFFDLVPVRKNWKYIEPCRASGRIYNRLPLGAAWAEIREGVDYLETDYPQIDCCITNPPYSIAQKFVEKALGHCNTVVMLLRLGFLESMVRHEWWKENSPDHLVICSKRPSFTEDGKTDGAGYAWYIWDKDKNLGLNKPFYWIGEKTQ